MTIAPVTPIRPAPPTPSSTPTPLRETLRAVLGSGRTVARGDFVFTISYRREGDSVTVCVPGSGCVRKAETLPDRAGIALTFDLGFYAVLTGDVDLMWYPDPSKESR